MARSRVVVACLAIGAASLSGWWLGETRRDATQRARVVRAIDGDTVIVALGDGSTDTVRILGADTPNVAEHHLRSPRAVLAGV